jgi:hypothetical protein
LKVEASVFRGREPDEQRWNFERPRLDSYAVRVTVNPGPRWSLQASVADIDAPEQIHPGLDVRKATVSMMYHRPFAAGSWSATAVVGANRWDQRTVRVAGIDFTVPARTQVAALLESAVRVRRWTVFTRVEAAEKDELFDPFDTRHNEVYPVAKLDLGCVVDVTALGSAAFGVGASGSMHILPDDLRTVYGGTPLSLRLFARLALR